MIGVIKRTGIEIAMNNVCSCINANVSAIPLAVPTNKERKLPAHVGHAINNPAAAPIEPALLVFLEIENALTASATFKPTK